MEQRKVSVAPGLLKIFDEILVNAADNYMRARESKSPTPMTHLKVVIDQDAGMISVWNNGPGIPIELHPEHKKIIPEMIFGDLRAGENFHDNQEKLWGGRNGYGAKLTNIFSSKVPLSHPSLSWNALTEKKYFLKLFAIIWRLNLPLPSMKIGREQPSPRSPSTPTLGSSRKKEHGLYCSFQFH